MSLILCIFKPISLGKPIESESCSVMSDSLRHHGLYSPWNSPGQSTVAFPFSRGSSQPRSPALQPNSLPAETLGKPKNTGVGSSSLLQWEHSWMWSLNPHLDIENSLSFQLGFMFPLLIYPSHCCYSLLLCISVVWKWLQEIRIIHLPNK